MAIGQYISPLDVIRTTANQTTVAAVIYESLYIRQAAGRIDPGLAEKTAVSPDALTWTITLRSGVKYHDLNADVGGFAKCLSASIFVAPLGRESMTPTTIVLNWFAELGR